MSYTVPCTTEVVILYSISVFFGKVWRKWRLGGVLNFHWVHFRYLKSSQWRLYLGFIFYCAFFFGGGGGGGGGRRFQTGCELHATISRYMILSLGHWLLDCGKSCNQHEAMWQYRQYWFVNCYTERHTAQTGRGRSYRPRVNEWFHSPCSSTDDRFAF